MWNKVNYYHVILNYTSALGGLLMIKKISLLISIILLILALTGCSKQNQEISKTVLKMDTVFQFKIYGSNAAKALDEAIVRIDEIEQMSSTTIVTSDISKINAAAGKDFVKVHPEIIKMLKTAVKYSELSNGTFDISIGPLIKLWGIGTDSARVPEDTEIKAKLQLVDYTNISINEVDNSVKLLKEGMSIDLGGIAKGYTADEVINIFKKHDIKNALISLGGSSVYTIGTKPDGTSWSIGIQHPRKDRNQELAAVINLSDQALSTSGDYERFFLKDNKRFHHILNPATGYPTDNGIMGVSIVIDSNVPDSNMLADILTKTVFVSGVDKGIKFIDSIPGVSCLAITTDYKIYKSSSWKKQLKSLNADFTLVN